MTQKSLLYCIILLTSFFASATTPENFRSLHQQLIQLANQRTEKYFLIVFPYCNVSYKSNFTFFICEYVLYCRLQLWEMEQLTCFLNYAFCSSKALKVIL